MHTTSDFQLGVSCGGVARSWSLHATKNCHLTPHPWKVQEVKPVLKLPLQSQEAPVPVHRNNYKLDVRMTCPRFPDVPPDVSWWFPGYHWSSTQASHQYHPDINPEVNGCKASALGPSTHTRGPLPISLVQGCGFREWKHQVSQQLLLFLHCSSTYKSSLVKDAIAELVFFVGHSWGFPMCLSRSLTNETAETA